MTYTVKEIFLTRQGEGANTGRRAVFCRFTGCNLWTGHEADRGRAVCQFCDTDFVGVGPDGGRFATAGELAAAVRTQWTDDPGDSSRPLVVCTGGEPLLQLDADAVDALHAAGFEVAVETNGTQHPPPGIDWLCVSPKAAAAIVVTGGQELKLVYPQRQPDAQPGRFEHLAFTHFFLQPMDSPGRTEANTEAAAAYCEVHPRWRVSRQMHKEWGIR